MGERSHTGNMTELSIGKQIELLQNRFRFPISTGLKRHRTADGKAAPCCQSAVAVMRSAVTAAAFTGGACDIVGYFTKKFSWGCYPAEFYCECMDHASELFCTATMLAGLESLSIYRSLCPPPVPFGLAAIDAIFIMCRTCVADNASAIAAAKSVNPKAIVHDSWLLADTCLHHLVGIIDCTAHLTLCDYDARMLCQQDSENSTVKLAAIRVSPWGGGETVSHSMPYHGKSHNALPTQRVTWNAITLPLGQWVDVRDAAPVPRLSQQEQVEALGSVYPTPRPGKEQQDFSPVNLGGVKRRPSATLSLPVAKVPRTCKIVDASPVSDDQSRSQKEGALTVLVSGVYMGSNPCPGVGVARALRAHYGAAGARLVAVDNCHFSDPVFDAFIPASDDAGASGEPGQPDGVCAGEYWRDVCAQLSHPGQELSALYIPCRDRDIEAAAAASRSSATTSLPSAFYETFNLPPGGDSTPTSRSFRLPPGIEPLCPAPAVVALTAKPSIAAATLGPLGAHFRAPEHMNLAGSDEQTASLVEIKAFADSIGYPVMLKGKGQGAALCAGWQAVRAVVSSQAWAQDGFLQRVVRGWERCLAFAAYRGVLSGCCMMTKGSYTERGKVWSGDIEPAPRDLALALARFVALTGWTGGGEIEFVEEPASRDQHFVTRDGGRFLPRSMAPPHSLSENDLTCLSEPRPQGTDTTHRRQLCRWVIDFNPRFPAWIFASTYAGCNLPALLVQDVLRACTLASGSGTGGIKTSAHDSPGGTAPGTAMKVSSDSISTGSSGAEDQQDDASSLAGQTGVQRASFVRSVIEVPVVHVPHYRHLPGLCTSTGVHSKAKAGRGTDGDPAVFVYPTLPDTCCVAQNIGPSLPPDASSSANQSHRVDCRDWDLRNLLRSASAVLDNHSDVCTPKYVLCADTLENTVRRLQAALTSGAAATGSEDMRVQPCLSVKTQPNAALLRIAAAAGYLAECIDMAEAYHCVDNAGFSWSQIVLTGPGKWWDCKSAAERTARQQSAVGRMHAIFADSLAELRALTLEASNPNAPHSADVIGIRWGPVLDISSRFGLDCKDAQVVRQAAELIASLPAETRLGMHFHHAPSALGAARWLALAKGFAVFCMEFATLCGRAVAVLDMGGGFEPFYLESEAGQQQMRNLMTFVRRCSEGAPPPTLQFELGKCVSESAGGVLTRVLAVRERERCGSDDEVPQAIIIDSTVADLSVPNSRAVFWFRPSAVSGAGASGTQGSASPSECNEGIGGGLGGGGGGQWELLPAGTAEIWGRTCMEWDKVLGLFAMPAGLRAGDLLLIAGCGAYDMSMQYGFGDGVARSDNVILC